MLSYHGDAAIKAKYVERAQAHRAADEVVQGTGWDGTAGCCIGCLAHDYPAHETLARDIGADEALFHLADSIHEGLPGHLAKTWPERFASAIPVGADLSRVRWRFLHWLLTDLSVNPGIEHDLVRDAVKAVDDLCMSAALGEMPSEDRWSAARLAAQSAAQSAQSARLAAWSARSARLAAWSARLAAWSAAEAAQSAEAEAAAWSAQSTRSAWSARLAEAAAWSAEAEAAWERMSEALLRFLAEAARPSETASA